MDAITWLLECDHPAVRRIVMLELLDYQPDDPQLKAVDPLTDGWVQTLFSGQVADGGFGVHPYQKWAGAHWRLVSLVELGLPAGEPRAVAAARTLLDWLNGYTHRSRIPVIEGRTRRCASQEGNALAVCSRLGLAGEPGVARLAQSLVGWQWPDGGWNCDKRPQASHSSFHESLIPMWGLVEYHRATGESSALAAARRTAEHFLERGLFRSARTGEIIHPEMIELHYPPYWHYDILQALLYLSRLEPLQDPRLGDVLDLLEQKRRPDGTWRASKHYWKPSEPGKLYHEVVDWGRSGSNIMITLNALRVLKSAGRISFQD